MAAMISMKVSASWEAEKSSSNAVPRLCNLSLAQIILDRPLEPDNVCTNFFVVVRMRGSARRVLRSPEITLVNSKAVCQNTALDPVPLLGESPGTLTGATTSAVGAAGCIPIDFNGSIQYSHLLNRNANILQILLQRRKKYKNKTMNLGYKTLAYCNVDLAQVLQRRIENRFLELYTDPNCTTHPIGRVEVQSLSTVPIEKDLPNGKRKGADEDEDYGLPDMYSEDSDRGDESDEDQLPENEETGTSRQKKIVKVMSIGQKQIKRKLINLLKKLKIGDPNEEDIDVAENSKLWDEFDFIATVSDIEEEEDSDPYIGDSVSIRSTPKPVLRPFFATTGGSDETVGADAGTKLLKRLHRQLFSQNEAQVDVRPDALPAQSGFEHCSTFQKPVPPPISILETKRNSNTATPVPSTSAPVQFPLTSSSRTDSSRLHHLRGSGLSSGGRLAKRFARMGRRSNFSLSSKQPLPASKSVEVPTVCRNIHSSDAYPPVSRGSYEKPSHSLFQIGVDSLSGYESSDGDLAPREPHSSGFPNNSDATSAPLNGDSVRTTLVLGARPSSDNPPHASVISPASTSTPDNNRRRISLGLLNCPVAERKENSSVRNEVAHLHPGSFDELRNMVFLVNLLEPGGKVAADLFASRDLRVTPVSSYPEIKQLFTRLVTEAQSQSFRPSDGGSGVGDPIKVCVLGGDNLVSFVLRVYVDQLSSRSAELAAAFRFFIIPVSIFALSKASSSTHPSPRRSLTSSQLVESHCNQFQVAPFVDSTVEAADKAASLIRGSATRVPLNNLISHHLCKTDSMYAALFQDALFESVSSINDPNSTSVPSEVKLSHSTLLDRALFYLTNSQNVLSLPVGSCLLAMSSAAPFSSRTSKTDPGLPSSIGISPIQSDPTFIPIADTQSSMLSTPSKVAATGGVALNEEVLVPFLLSVCLGPCVGYSVYTHSCHTRPIAGDPMVTTVPSTAELISVLSDPEASGGVCSVKRHKSPETSATRSPRGYSTFHAASTNSPDNQFWDIQLEYWIPHSINVTASGVPPSGSSNTVATNAPSISIPGTDQVSSRRNTMKVVCRGLSVILTSGQNQMATRLGDVPSSVIESNTSTPLIRTSGLTSIPVQSLLTLAVWSKEKKQKIMRLGRRGKDCGCKFEMIEGIQRLLCTGRGSMCVCTTSSSTERCRDSEHTSHSSVDAGCPSSESAAKGATNTITSQNVSTQSAPFGVHSMTVFIDGVEWTGLKFFQVTPSWRTHIKCFPVCSLSCGRQTDPHPLSKSDSVNALA